MATVSLPAEQRLRLSAIPWEDYLAYSNRLAQRHIRVTYDRAEMEVMTLSPEHEHQKKLLARLVEALTEELEINIASFGSMTCRREESLRGLEPDESYWIEHEPQVRGRDDIDLENDPPPHLALEVDISRSTLDRMAIYAGLGVPEVWRWDGVNLQVFLLSSRGAYRPNRRSKAFPLLPLASFAQFLKKSKSSETALLRTFRDWVRENRAEWVGS